MLPITVEDGVDAALGDCAAPDARGERVAWMTVGIAVIDLVSGPVLVETDALGVGSLELEGRAVIDAEPLKLRQAVCVLLAYTDTD